MESGAFVPLWLILLVTIIVIGVIGAAILIRRGRTAPSQLLQQPVASTESVRSTLVPREISENHDVFLSYASAERDNARLVAAALQETGHSVFWDRTILPGLSFDDVIEAKIEAAGCIVVLWSSEAVKSRWVRNEASEGLRRNALVPVLLEDIKIPLEFRSLQAATLVHWRGSSKDPEFGNLRAAVTRVLSRE